MGSFGRRRMAAGHSDQTAPTGSIEASISLSSMRVISGGSVERIVSVARTDYLGAITITVTGLPTGCTYSVTALDPYVDVDENDRFELSIICAAATTPEIDHSITVTATGTGISDNISCALTIEAPLSNFTPNRPASLDDEWDDDMASMDYWNDSSHPTDVLNQKYGGFYQPQGNTYAQSETAVSFTSGNNPYGTVRHKLSFTGNTNYNGTGPLNPLFSANRKYSKFYGALSFKLSASYQVYILNGSEKFFYMGYDTEALQPVNANSVAGTGLQLAWNLDGSPTGPLFNMLVAFQSGNAPGPGSYTTSVTARKGEDNHLEWFIQMNSAADVADGIYKVWMNGTLAYSDTAVNYNTVAEANAPVFLRCSHFSGVRGGGTAGIGTPPEGQARFFNRFVAAGIATLTRANSPWP